jgi:signal transduction histidine kinase
VETPRYRCREREKILEDTIGSRLADDELATTTRLAPPSSIAIAVILALVVAITAIGVAAERRSARAERRAEAEHAAGLVALRVEAAVDEVVSAVEDTTRFVLTPRGPAILGVVPPPAGTTAIGFLAPVDGRRVAVAAGEVAPELAAADDVLTATGRARDQEEVMLSGPVVLGDGAIVAVVVPLYRGTSGLSRTSGAESTTGRRAAIAGWVVAAVDPDWLQTATSTEASVADGATVLSGDRTSGSSVALQAEVRDRSWTVTAPIESVSGLPGAAPWLLAACVAIVLAIVAGAGAGIRARRRAASSALAYRKQADMIRRFAPVVQQSLDLADVLPALAVQLVDELHLTGMSLGVVGSNGQEIALFAVGDITDDDEEAIPPDVRVPASLAAGERLTLALGRAGRAVATVRLRAGRDLDRTELESIQVACELTTAAMVNARTFEQQQEAVDRLSSVDQLKTVFLATASHELRTPVTAIASFSSLLDERWDDLPETERRQFVSRIAHNSRFLGALVQDLLDFSQLERGRLVVSMEPIEVEELMAATVERLTPFWPTHTITLDVVERGRVEADRVGLERVFTNLISNAVKFSPTGSTVTITIDRDGDMASVTVDDEGPGVPVADRERVFSSFFRGSASEVVRTRGAGIGLSVAKQYVDQMGGSIAVGDSPAGGARFTVRLRSAAVEHPVLTPDTGRADDEGS